MLDDVGRESFFDTTWVLSVASVNHEHISVGRFYNGRFVNRDLDEIPLDPKSRVSSYVFAYIRSVKNTRLWHVCKVKLH